MYSFRRLAVLLALLLPVAHVGFAEESSSSSTPTAQDQTQQPEASANQSVQARIKARREQRRAQAIHDTYSNLYEIFAGGGYLRFRPGPDVQLATMYSWDAAITRYFNPKLGVTVDGRGYYGTAYVGLNEASITRPSVSNYGVLAGPTYRFILHPKYSVAAHVMGGVAIGNFSGDANGFDPRSLGLYPDCDYICGQCSDFRGVQREPEFVIAARAGLLPDGLRLDDRRTASGLRTGWCTGSENSRAGPSSCWY